MKKNRKMKVQGNEFTNKTFDQALCDKYDPIAKAIMASFFTTLGKYLLDVPFKDQYEKYQKGDLMLLNLETLKHEMFEGEIKLSGWNVSGKWNLAYATLHVPGRKYECEADWIVVINRKLDTLWFAPIAVVKKSPITIEPVRNRDEPDGFFNVDPEHPEVHFATTKAIEGHWAFITYKGELVEDLGKIVHFDPPEIPKTETSVKSTAMIWG